MKVVALLAALMAVCLAEQDDRHNPPKVLVYSRDPGQFGKENILICRASDFHPPDITIVLTRNGVAIPNANQTDLAFKKDWRFHLTTSVKFTPVSGEEYNCKVTHGKITNHYAWESNM
ncbi:beta-2-microglobulin-like [Centropristis striata]|uniref:beta-2-microglobulin-like n=1 Tax=Centropristis striata TaxID=184440 RepID=UPI0027E0B913|nr:beta-2-microglobulin-like [Centropristis striata]